MTALTWLENGRLKFASLAGDGSFVLGRNEEADIVIDSPDKTISRRHARLAVKGGASAAENLSSTNVTRINGTPITGRAALSDGDSLQLGTTVLTFHDLSRSMILSGLICSNCHRENPASQKDCWFCGQNLVNALSVALRNRTAACRVVTLTGAVTDIFVGRGAGIRAGGEVEALRAGQQYAARIEASGENVPALVEGETATTLSSSRTFTAGGHDYLVLLP